MDGKQEMELDREQLIALVIQLREENTQLKQRVAELEKRAPTKRLNEPYSLRSEDERQAKSHKKKRKQKSKRRGRLKTQDKLDQAERTEVVLPEGFSQDECELVRRRPVLRIENGRAVRIAYEFFRGPGGEMAEVPGVLPYSEHGLEIHVALAYWVFIMGVSIDKVLEMLKFFWELELSKSQADALLTRLARDWQSEFDALCQLLAVSAVVHADETSWSINSVWAFLSEKVRILVFGCHKDGQTLDQLLSKKTFQGVLVSDDASVYRDFSTSQKCWAHLIRKAIRLTLLEPECEEYRQFLDGLVKVYRAACKHAKDQRLGESGRRRKVDEFSDQMCALCGDRFSDETTPANETEKDYRNLVHELVRLLGDEELFTFVLHPEATGTNNEAERILRSPAKDRRTGRTSKTLRGARRRTILVSVLESLRLHLPEFTLQAVLNEITTWTKNQSGLFGQLLITLGLGPPDISPLDHILPSTAS